MSFRRLFEKFKPASYNLTLDLTKAKVKKFNGRVLISGRIEKIEQEFIRLHSKDLEITEIIFSPQSDYPEILKFEIDSENDELNIFLPKEKEEIIEILVDFSGEITDSMHGLYPCYYSQNDEKKQLLATQFESHHAREVFPCVDEPEAKAVFNLTIKSGPNEDVISCMPIKSQEKNEILITKFEQTPIMSTYLLAFSVGDLQRKTAKTKNGVEISVISTKAQREELLDFPLDIAVRVLEFYEDYFGVKFPLKKCDHIALPDFSSGAMENWGLITYRESALLAGENSSISSKKYVALVIAHETAHQWFGNLVTMKWWDDLWLNESFANMMEYLALDNIEPKWNIWEEFAVNEAVIALRRDAIDGVQPVHVPVNHPDEINTIFDGAIVYAKGARLMNMLRAYVGDENFRKGLHNYFVKFAYKNTIGADLWNCLSEESGLEVSNFMNYWLNQPGYPVLLARYNDNKLNLSQSQFFVGEGEDKNRLWPIILGASSDSLPKIMNNSEITLNFNLSSKYLKFNEQNRSHFVVNYDDILLNKILLAISNGELDVISRLQILQERSLLARSGKISSASILNVLRMFKKESSLSVWNMINLSLSEIIIFVEKGTETETKMHKFVHDIAESEFKKLGFTQKESEPEESTQLRSMIISLMIYAKDENATKKALEIYTEINKAEEINSEIRSLVLSTKIREEESIELINDFLGKYKSTSNVDFREDIRAAITNTKNAKTAENIFDLITKGGTIRFQDVLSWYVNFLRNDFTRDVSWTWLRKNWSWVKETFSGDKSYDDFIRYSANTLRTENQLQEFTEFFSEMKKENSLARTILMGEKEIKAKIALIAREKPAVEKALKEL